MFKSLSYLCIYDAPPTFIYSAFCSYLGQDYICLYVYYYSQAQTYILWCYFCLHKKGWWWSSAVQIYDARARVASLAVVITFFMGIQLVVCYATRCFSYTPPSPPLRVAFCNLNVWYVDEMAKGRVAVASVCGFLYRGTPGRISWASHEQKDLMVILFVPAHTNV